MFRFPSNGKAQTDNGIRARLKIVYLFRFPLNGKAQTDEDKVPSAHIKASLIVSIPFKREDSIGRSRRTGLRNQWKVSIPFKREHTGRLSEKTVFL